MAEPATYMTCYGGPLDGSRVPVTGAPASLDLEVLTAAALSSFDQIDPPMKAARFATYRVDGDRLVYAERPE